MVFDILKLLYSLLPSDCVYTLQPLFQGKYNLVEMLLTVYKEKRREAVGKDVPI